MSEAAKLRTPRFGWSHTEEVKQHLSKLRTGFELPPESLRSYREKCATRRKPDEEREFERPQEWRDKIGESNAGSNNGMAKLNEDKVREIKHLLAACELTQQKIADTYGVSRSLIRGISQGKRWKHVTT